MNFPMDTTMNHSITKRLFVVLFLAFATVSYAAPSVVSNVRASQRPGTKLVDIYFDLADTDGDLQLVHVAISADAGLTYGIPCASLSGSVGTGVTLGSNKHIVWNAGADWNGNWVPQCRARITAFDGTTPPAPPGMAYIPPGPFQMGDSFGELGSALPLHQVYVSGFYMDETFVSKETAKQITAWGAANGYVSLGFQVKGPGHPVCYVRWSEAILFCNMRSEMDGFVPVYYADSAFTTVRRNYLTGGIKNFSNSFVKWDASGYRLPTEAEWEKAARGGAHGLRYSWGDTLDFTKANYSYPGNPWADGNFPYTSHVRAFAPNGYGLFDMGGNLLSWVGDDWSTTYYGSPASLTDPKGPGTGSLTHILRGGSFNCSGGQIACATRFSYYINDNSNGNELFPQDAGVRCVRKAP